MLLSPLILVLAVCASLPAGALPAALLGKRVTFASRPPPIERLPVHKARAYDHSAPPPIPNDVARRAITYHLDPEEHERTAVTRLPRGDLGDTNYLSDVTGNPMPPQTSPQDASTNTNPSLISSADPAAPSDETPGYTPYGAKPKAKPKGKGKGKGKGKNKSAKNKAKKSKAKTSDLAPTLT